jgi:RimJ/RimL family protein N-acetyltransferase
MIRGEKVGLRAQHEEDVPILHHELYEDVATRSRAEARGWRPLTPARSPVAAGEPSDTRDHFFAVDLASGELAGEAVLWGLNVHHRTAHVGISLRPSFRGRGLGTDTVRTMCLYGFTVRGLRRLQIETLADNHAMITAALRAGFTREGTARRAAFVYGRELDEALFGMLADEWTHPRHPEIPPGICRHLPAHLCNGGGGSGTCGGGPVA